MDYVASHRSQIKRNGFALSKTYGTSMRPLIWGGEHYVAVVPLESEPTVGDLLMFQSPLGDCSVIHRLVEIKEDVGQRIYITRGDNCLGCETVRREDIIGRVAEIHRISGFRPWHAIPARKFTVTDAAYLRYSHIWRAIWPVRRCYYLLRAHARGLRVRLLSVFKPNR